MSNYYLDSANVERIRQQFDLFDAEAKTLLEKGLAIPAYVYFYNYTASLLLQTIVSSDIFYEVH